MLESVRGSVRETPRWAGQKVGDNLEEEKGPSLTPFLVTSVPSFNTLPCRPGQPGQLGPPVFYSPGSSATLTLVSFLAGLAVLCFP